MEGKWTVFRQSSSGTLMKIVLVCFEKILFFFSVLSYRPFEQNQRLMLLILSKSFKNKTLSLRHNHPDGWIRVLCGHQIGKRVWGTLVEDPSPVKFWPFWVFPTRHFFDMFALPIKSWVIDFQATNRSQSSTWCGAFWYWYPNLAPEAIADLNCY